VWDGRALRAGQPKLGTVSPDGAGAKRQLHRINSPADGDFIPLKFDVTQIFIFCSNLKFIAQVKPSGGVGVSLLSSTIFEKMIT